jgi:ATP dependent DNA ligase C terminal region/ATP dependent DNA ligase domain
MPSDHSIVYYAFDLLHVDRVDCTPWPLHRRREQLARVVVPDGALRLSQELPGSAADVIEAIRAAGLEGVVAKRRSSTYQPGGRSSDRVKLKLHCEQEFVIGGFRGNRSDGVDALIVGFYEQRTLLFAAKVRAGMVLHVRRELFKQLSALSIARCPFDNLPDAKMSHWGGGVTADEMTTIQRVQPNVVAQIRFEEWTDNARLRASRYGRRASCSRFSSGKKTCVSGAFAGESALQGNWVGIDRSACALEHGCERNATRHIACISRRVRYIQYQAIIVLADVKADIVGQLLEIGLAPQPCDPCFGDGSDHQHMYSRQHARLNRVGVRDARRQLEQIDA